MARLATAVPEPAVPETGDRRDGGARGRPTRAAASLLPARILAAATALFLREGFAATSMEAVAAAAGISKRTLYQRFPDKPALWQAAVAALIDQWRPPFDAALADDTSNLSEALLAAASRILAVALMPEALALHRLMVVEAARLPELGRALHAAGARAGVAGIAARLRHAAQRGEWRCPPDWDAEWAAEQFMHLVLAGPQQRALGLGSALDEAGLAGWGASAVQLFLGARVEASGIVQAGGSGA